jgi:hypothetical protein
MNAADHHLHGIPDPTSGAPGLSVPSLRGFRYGVADDAVAEGVFDPVAGVVVQDAVRTADPRSLHRLCVSMLAHLSRG